jgi:hypothetical protein
MQLKLREKQDYHSLEWIQFGIFGIAIPALMATLYWGGMLIGRLVSSSLSSVSPRAQLAVTSVLAACFAIASMITDNPWLLAAVGLFHSVMWGSYLYFIS